VKAIRVANGKTAIDTNSPEPAPGTGHALLAVTMAGICATDLEIVRGYMSFEGVLGHEFVGTVLAGPRHLKGKRVVCEINCVCGKCEMCQSGLSTHCRNRTVLGIAGRDGCFAEHIAVPETNLHEVPDGISNEEAVFVEPVAAAIQVTKQVPVEPRMRVAVLGSGRLGLLVAQVLRTVGCRLELIGRNSDSLLVGEKKGIQSTLVADVAPRNDRDLVVDCTGSPQGLELAMRLVRPRGTIVLKSTFAQAAPINTAPLVVNEIELRGSRCGPFPDAIKMLARKQIDVLTMISKRFPLDRGLEALEAAADPRNIKVLLRIAS
jgi:threonine dehydrogenase-like Zn-dependent dehydrogenase